MQEKDKQNTFLSLGELLERAARQCRAAERELRSFFDEVPEPEVLAYREMAERECELAEMLKTFARRAPETTLNTRVQFTLDCPERPAPQSAHGAAQQMVEFNEDLVESLQEQSRTMTPDSVAESLETLWRDTEALARQVSMTFLTMQDA